MVGRWWGPKHVSFRFPLPSSSTSFAADLSSSTSFAVRAKYKVIAVLKGLNFVPMVELVLPEGVEGDPYEVDEWSDMTRDEGQGVRGASNITIADIEEGDVMAM